MNTFNTQRIEKQQVIAQEQQTHYQQQADQQKFQKNQIGATTKIQMNTQGFQREQNQQEMT